MTRVRIPLRLRLWGWMTAIRVSMSERALACEHDGHAPICSGCAMIASFWPMGIDPLHV